MAVAFNYRPLNIWRYKYFMSSYVIDKRSYIRVAGIVAALNDSHNFYGIESGLHLFDIENYRVYDDEGIYKMFEVFYNRNAHSVAEQYHDPEQEEDSQTYQDEFETYKLIGKRAAHDTEELERIAYMLVSFSKSVDYQIENRNDNEFVMNKFNSILCKIFSIIQRRYYEDITCWGEFEYVSPEQEKINERQRIKSAEEYSTFYCD